MKAVICGAGISGLSAAAFLARDGWQVIVLEQSREPRPQGYIIDFFGPGWQAASGLGIVPRLRELGYQIQKLDYVDRHGKARATLPFAGLAQVVSGGLISILRPDLELAIREGLPPEVDLRYGRTVSAVGQSREGVTVTLDDGQVLEADLLIGADGIHSTIRELAFGPEEEFFHYLGFQVGAYSFRDPELAARIGDRVAATDTRNEAMFFYRLRDGGITAMAAHREGNPAIPDDPQAQLRSRYRRLGWICPAAVEHCPEDLYYDQVAQIRMPRWHTGRVVLLGDAAAAVSLLAGQGASLGMAAAQALAEELRQHTAIGTALASFEERVRPAVEEQQKAGVSAAQWFVPATRYAAFVRRTAVRLAKVPGVRWWMLIQPSRVVISRTDDATMATSPMAAKRLCHQRLRRSWASSPLRTASRPLSDGISHSWAITTYPSRRGSPLPCPPCGSRWTRLPATRSISS